MTFQKSSISLSDSGQFSKLFIDYINKRKPIASFYSYAPELSSFQAIIEKKGLFKNNRKLLVEVLNDQYRKAGLSSNQIQLLAKENTYTVCTGHQLCVFTGPLYFIYKIISTINLAEQLQKKYPSHHFIPVYWMASEDHDFGEISSIHLFGKTITWNNTDAAGAVGRLSPASLQAVLNELKQILGDSENAVQLIQLFTQAYTQHSTLAAATHWLVHQLFKEHGLLIIDGDDKRFKSSFTQIMQDDLINNTNYELVNQTITQLETLNHKVQVNPRPINLFYIKEGIRERIEKKEEGAYQKVNSGEIISKEELIQELKNYPEHFSPNVVLRPVYQQYLLPNLAYVGGPGELAYWLEYKTMFDYHKVFFPVLIPRNFALLLDQKTNQQLNKAGLSVKELFKDTDVIIKELVLRNSHINLSLQEQQNKLQMLFNELSLKAERSDSTLKAVVEAEYQKALNGLKNIENKLMRSEKQKQDTLVNQIKKIKERLIPQGMLQERYDNFSPYYLKYGKNFISELKKEFDPFDFTLLILSEEE